MKTNKTNNLNLQSNNINILLVRNLSQSTLVVSVKPKVEEGEKKANPIQHWLVNSMGS